MYIGLTFYLLVVIWFAIAIYSENQKNEYQFTLVQFIVAVLWPLWGIWYLWDLSREAYTNWKNK